MKQRACELIYTTALTVNHRLPIECGRWKHLERENRKCNLCNSDIGDEFHYILMCPFFENERKTYIKKHLYRRPDILCFKKIMSKSFSSNMLNNLQHNLQHKHKLN
jgi:hypothetical protein